MEQPKKKKSRTGIVIAALATAIGMASGVVGVVAYFQNQHHTASFTGELTSLRTAQDFAAFLKQHDQSIVQLDVECGETDVNLKITADSQIAPDSRCFFFPGKSTAGDSKQEREMGVLTTGKLTATQYWSTPSDTAGVQDGVVWFDVDIPASGSDSSVTNGPKGAGWIIVKGYFSESKVELGNAPPDVDQYELRAVDISQVTTR